MQKQICRLIIVILLAMYSTLANAQLQKYRFEHYSIEEGLSQSVAECIFHDSKGFLWIGTGEGLNRFDGISFKIYKSIPSEINSLSDSWVLRILLEDSDGELWMLTSDGLVNRFNPKTERFVHYGNSDETKQRTFSIFEDSRKNVWIANSQNILQINKQNNKVQVFPMAQFGSKPIHCIAETPDKKLFFGSLGGLWFFNSEKNKFEQTSPEIKEVYSFRKSPNGTFYSLNQSQICEYSEKIQKFVCFPINNPLGEKSKIIQALFDSQNRLWLLSPDFLLEFNTKTKTSEKIHYPNKELDKQNNYTHIFIDSRKNFWIGTNNGIGIYNIEKKIFTKFKNPDKNGVRKIVEDKTGEIWALGQMVLGNNGSLLFAVDQDRKELVQMEADPAVISSLPINYINDVYKDNYGNLWFGSFGNGLIKLITQAKKFNLFVHDSRRIQSPACAGIFGFAEDLEGKIWINYLGYGIDQYNPKNETFEHFTPNTNTKLPINSPSCIVADKKGNLWLGKFLGEIVRINTKTLDYKIFKPEFKDETLIKQDMIRTMYISGDSLLFAGTTTNGMIEFNLKNEKFTYHQSDKNNPKAISFNSIWHINGDSKGNIWILCEGFIDCMNLKTRNIKRYKSKSTNFTGINVEKALCSHETKDGRIWFGTVGGGLACFNPKTEKFAYITEKDGLANNFIYGILEDNANNLWMSTNKGISVYNYLSKKFRNYYATDGLQSNEFNSHAFFKDKNGKMYFGGINGFNSFYPNEIIPDTSNIPLAITGFKIFNREINILPENEIQNHKKNATDIVKLNAGKYFMKQNIPYSDTIILSWQEKVLTIEFSALNFEERSRMCYRYKLEGFEKEWNYTADRLFATYTNLPAGEYKFLVQASYIDGSWNSKPAKLVIIVKPPFWKTWPFVISEILVALLLLIGFIKLRERSHKNDKRILEEKVKRRTMEINEKNQALIHQNELIGKQKQEIEFQAQQIQKELIHQNETSEMALLRTQINPHFLFNTLNNIYSLVIQNSTDAPVAIMKLSEILRYMLYDSTEEFVILEKEVNYLKSFIELQLLRIKDKNFVKFEIQGDISTVKIAPMLLISFIENAFKHGNKKAASPGISIFLEIRQQKITFEMRNAVAQSNIVAKDSTGGIGIPNVERRLQLLYPHRHKLHIERNTDEFKVYLEIDNQIILP